MKFHPCVACGRVLPEAPNPEEVGPDEVGLDTDGLVYRDHWLCGSCRALVYRDHWLFGSCRADVVETQDEDDPSDPRRDPENPDSV